MPGRRPEDIRLSDAFRVAYEAAGVSQTQIADALPGIDQPAVSKWARGERPPPLWTLPIIDRLCGKAAGHILRIAGFVEPDTSVTAAIASDPKLDDSGRELLGMAYNFCVQAALNAGLPSVLPSQAVREAEAAADRATAEREPNHPPSAAAN